MHSSADGERRQDEKTGSLWHAITQRDDAEVRLCEVLERNKHQQGAGGMDCMQKTICQRKQKDGIVTRSSTVLRMRAKDQHAADGLHDAMGQMEGAVHTVDCVTSQSTTKGPRSCGSTRRSPETKHASEDMTEAANVQDCTADTSELYARWSTSPNSQEPH
jgi:hypothetical protein